MLQFLKYVLATLVGLFLFFFVGFILMLGLAAAVGSRQDQVQVKANSVLRLDLDRAIVENDNTENPFSNIGPFKATEQAGVIQIKQALAAAAKDAHISGVALKAGMPRGGWGSLQEIRNALTAFRKSGKFVYAYDEAYDEQGYYLASMADRLYVAPTGMIEFNGLAAETEFFKGTLEKLDIQPVIFRVGTYKSAVEPFLLDKMSEASREQTQSFLHSIYDAVLNDISKSRNVPVAQLRQTADSLTAFQPMRALQSRLVTNVGYMDEFENEIRRSLKLDTDKKINYVGLNSYLKAAPASTGPGENRVAVIVGAGEIVSGENESSEQLASETFIKELRKARQDDKVKAVVLRINSPGGSGLASDVMWREIQLLKKKKPVVASMSDYAASGGYYLAMGCNKIVAQPTTITGSIGVFSLLFRVDNFLKNKLGVTLDRVKTNAHADWPTLTREMDAFEKARFQQWTDQFYDIFTKKAAEGRHMSQARLQELASGRVWSGSQARANGLVDALGGLDDAIRLAASEAKLKDGDYRVKYPARRSFLESLMEDLKEEQESRLLQNTLGDLAPYAHNLRHISTWQGLQARMPYTLRVK